MATVLYWCAVPGCPSKYRKKSEDNENFFRFPNPDCLKVLHMQKLARIRLKKWEAAIPNRRTASNRICSKHFVTGCPAALTSINDVDWVPTVNLVAAFSAKNKIPLTNEKQPLREMYVPGVQPSILQNISFQNVTIQRTPVRCAVPANDVLFHSVEKGSTVPGGLSARRINVNDTESATSLPSRSNSTYSYEPRRQERSVRSEPANIPELETTQMWSQNVERPRDMSALFHSVHKGSAVAARRIDVKNNLLPSRSKSTDPYERHEREMRLVRSEPTNIPELKMTYMWNQKAERPRDANASMTAANNADIVSVGHCHPKVVEAGSRQIATLSTNNRFLHDELVKCAQTLTDKMPGNLSVCYFVNSGSEANDLALRLARQHTKRHEVITLDHAYHGHVSAVMEISPYKFNQPGGDPKPDFVHVAPCPDVYRGKHRDCDYPEGTDMGQLYVDEVARLVESSQTGIAAFIAESLQSCGGQIIPPKDYFKKVYKIIRDAGGVTIADEVQVGFGRIGTHYWAFEPHDVIPDIVTVAKPMGNGHPVGAVVTTPEIAESFASTGVCYFNTYGGNPVSCAIANAVMSVIDEENLQDNAFIVGKYLLDQCRSLRYEYDVVGDVRGTGLFVGIELVTNRKERTPATKMAKAVVDRMKNTHKILVSSDGPNDNVIKLKPPMVFNAENADEFLYGFRECLTYLENLEKSQHTGNPEVRAVLTIPVPATGGLCSLANSTISEKREKLIKSV